MENETRLVYGERLPSPALAPWVECYWSVRGTHLPGETTLRTVLPDGCMDVIFDVAPGAQDRDPSFVVGTMTRQLPVRSSGSVHLIGVRFRPGGAPPFVPVPAEELVDLRAPLDELWGPRSLEALERVSERGVQGLEEVLTGQLRRGRDDPTVRRAARLLGQAAPLLGGVDAVADRVGVSRRQLERRFRSAVGVPPVALARILRFRRAADLLADRNGPPLAWVAAQAGYHDQPHMTRDFRELAGTTPGVYRSGVQPPPEAARLPGAGRVASVQDPLPSIA